MEIETGLSDDSLSEKLWENNEVSDWGGDVDSEVGFQRMENSGHVCIFLQNFIVN